MIKHIKDMLTRVNNNKDTRRWYIEILISTIITIVVFLGNVNIPPNQPYSEILAFIIVMSIGYSAMSLLLLALIGIAELLKAVYLHIRARHKKKMF